MSGDVTKLPKWAQQHIEALERNVEHWRKRAHVGNEPTRQFINRYGDNNTYLTDEQITWGDPERWHTHITVRADSRGGIYIQSGEALAVHPQSSNVIRVDVVER